MEYYDVSAINEALGIEGPDLIENIIGEDEDYLNPEEQRKRKNQYMKEYNKKYYHENPERAKEWRDKRVEQRRKSYSDWYRQNREKVLEYKRKQYQEKKATK